MTPLMIQMLIACHITPFPDKMVGIHTWNSLTANESRNWMLKEGLIDSDYKATDRGAALIKILCATPLPVQKTIWVKGDT